MTKPNPAASAAVSVEQCDRDAAAALLSRWEPGLWRDAGIIADGNDDGHRFVQAFARHRIAAWNTRQQAARLTDAGGDWVLVPREPVNAVVYALAEAYDDDRSWEEVWQIFITNIQMQLLAAAPKPPSAPSGSGDVLREAVLEEARQIVETVAMECGGDANALAWLGVAASRITAAALAGEAQS